MITCEIVLVNSESKEETKDLVEVVSFPEAVREAYHIRTTKGHDWKIKSVIDISPKKK